MTHRDRIMRVLHGKIPDRLTYAPRFDIWYNANSISGTLPSQYAHSSPDEIARGEGWALHKQEPDYLRPESDEDVAHRGLGLFSVREMCFRCLLPSDVAVTVERDGPRVVTTYSTPVGEVTTTAMQDAMIGQSGASLSWISEYAIKTVSDYAPLSYIFDGLRIIEDFTRYRSWRDSIIPDGIAVTMASTACSPVHHIQHDLIDPTNFFYHYSDYKPQLQKLASSIANYYEQALDILKQSPADAVVWGGNIDEMLTPPDYFARDIMPWIQRASEELQGAGIPVAVHCDGENARLINLIPDSGFSCAEGLCPAPMTRLRLRDYYEAWSPRLAIWGGIPSALLVPELYSDEEFEAFLDEMFASIGSGAHFIVGFGDTAPPNASFERMVRIGERVRKDGELPLAAGRWLLDRRVAASDHAASETKRVEGVRAFAQLWGEVQDGAQARVVELVDHLLAEGVSPEQILTDGLVAPLEDMGEKFSAGEVFMPELLLSARAVASAIDRLAPLLAPITHRETGTVLIGTVEGDLHDLGKNLVALLLRTAGFHVVDLGVNVTAERFVISVGEEKPLALGLSSLLTTTMSEMKRVIEKLEEAGLRKSLAVIVGGAPITEQYATLIGADGYAADAAAAVSVFRSLQ